MMEDQQEGYQESQDYMVQRASPTTIQVVVTDDSPTAAADAFWEFLGIDIPVANIEKADFRVILDIVYRNVMDYIKPKKVEDWDAIKFQELRRKLVWKGVKCPTCGALTDGIKLNLCPECSKNDVESHMEDYGREENVLINEWSLPQMWNKLEMKVYAKLTRARGGFTFRGLTENRHFMHQEFGGQQPPMAGVGYPYPPQYQQEKKVKKKKWGLF